MILRCKRLLTDSSNDPGMDGQGFSFSAPFGMGRTGPESFLLKKFIQPLQGKSGEDLSMRAKNGASGELNPGPPAPKAGIIPLDY
ncbi:hypothetical protein RvY_12989-2 [Ramazzottius varieornatus]|uniref:Uncharacterized protein n=1 Tax=Ramazzottius varieornatus TaxID=947166 RepID=A0A1D1VLC2_RAMVA|nr:hypothetical protein RvY_12989-2 [Ramazzottius varieornatus]